MIQEVIRVPAGPDAQDGDGADHRGLDGAGRLREELRAPRQATDPQRDPLRRGDARLCRAQAWNFLQGCQILICDTTK